MSRWTGRPGPPAEAVPSIDELTAKAVELARRDAVSEFPDEFIGTTTPPAVLRLHAEVDGYLASLAQRHALDVKAVQEDLADATTAREVAASRLARATDIAAKRDRLRCAPPAETGPRTQSRTEPLLPRGVGVAVLLLVALGEIPLLRLVFELLDASTAESVVMVVGAEVALLACAHLAGGLLRRRGGGIGAKVGRVAAIALVGAVLASVVGAIGVLRADRIERDARFRQFASDIQVTGTTDGADTVAAPVADVSTTKATWVFVSLQLLYVMVAVGVGASTEPARGAHPVRSGYLPAAAAVRLRAWSASWAERDLRKANAAAERLAERISADVAVATSRARGVLATYYEVLVSESPQEKAAAFASLTVPQVAQREWPTAWKGLLETTAAAPLSYAATCPSTCPLLTIA